MRILPAAVDEVASVSSPDFSESVERTRTVLARGAPDETAAPVIFQAHLIAEPSGNAGEPGAEVTGVITAVVDIVERGPDGSCFLWEVKASTSLSPLHDYDLAFQVLVALRAGLSVSGCGLFLLEKNYVRGPDGLDPDALLRRVDRTSVVFELLPTVEADLSAQFSVVSANMTPDVSPGRRCRGSRKVREANRPSNCGHLERKECSFCGRDLPDWWVGDLPRLNAKTESMLQEQSLADMTMIDPLDSRFGFSDAQRRVIEGARTGAVWIDAAALRSALAPLEYPLTAIDFEFDPGMAVPLWEGCSPYSRVPFQWSMHVQASESASFEERAPFLFDQPEDPTGPFLESLFDALPESGSILVHHRSAEEGVLQQAAERVGGDWPVRVKSLESRLFDTEKLLKAGYHHPEQRGSYSLKNVAGPLLGRGFGDLSIQNGMMAVMGWKRLVAATKSEERSRLRGNLLAYCGRDTELLLEIVREIRRLSAT
jgi:hypothetical protein